MNEQDLKLPTLIDRAQRCLADARTSAEVFEARAAPQAALHYAKLVKAANETQADCLKMIARTEIRMANEIDAGRGGEAGAIVKALSKMRTMIPPRSMISTLTAVASLSGASFAMPAAGRW